MSSWCFHFKIKLNTGYLKYLWPGQKLAWVRSHHMFPVHFNQPGRQIRLMQQLFVAAQLYQRNIIFSYGTNMEMCFCSTAANIWCAEKTFNFWGKLCMYSKMCFMTLLWVLRCPAYICTVWCTTHYTEQGYSQLINRTTFDAGHINHTSVTLVTGIIKCLHVLCRTLIAVYGFEKQKTTQHREEPQECHSRVLGWFHFVMTKKWCVFAKYKGW